MPHETEAKFPVESFEAVRRALRKAGAAYRFTVLQTDTYYDTPERSLLAADQGLRIRRLRYLRSARGHRDDRPELTFKGSGNGSRRAKVRHEIQTRIDDADALEAVLQAAGLVRMLTIRKRRASYHLAGCTIELDKLPMIGRFVEVEAPDEEHLDRVRRRLGLTGEPVTDHYVNLVTRKCSRLSRDCSEATAENCRRCPRKP